MSKPAKIFWGGIGFFAALFLGSTLLIAAPVVASGMVHVEVDEPGPDGVHLNLPIPAVALDAALALVPRLVPPEELAEMRREVGEFGPMITAVAEALAESPNVRFVEVESADEHIRVSKVGGRIEIQVESADTDVRVSLPARILPKATRALGL